VPHIWLLCLVQRPLLRMLCTLVFHLDVFHPVLPPPSGNPSRVLAVSLLKGLDRKNWHGSFWNMRSSDGLRKRICGWPWDGLKVRRCGEGSACPPFSCRREQGSPRSIRAERTGRAQTWRTQARDTHPAVDEK
jgi:hypothetical protein